MNGTIYVSGAVGALKGPDGKPMIVPGHDLGLGSTRADRSSTLGTVWDWMQSLAGSDLFAA